jgi:hypothetical protein
VNFYSDTDRRMQDDAGFRAAVHMLMALAAEHGFTPGELKQIAFRAALELEMRNPGSPITVAVARPVKDCPTKGCQLANGHRGGCIGRPDLCSEPFCRQSTDHPGGLCDEHRRILQSTHSKAAP